MGIPRFYRWYAMDESVGSAIVTLKFDSISQMKTNNVPTLITFISISMLSSIAA